MARGGFLAVLAVAGCGLAALWWGTDGLAAFTAEGARRLDVARHPRPLPDVTLEDHLGQPARLSDHAGRVVLLDFIYTRCPTVCVALGSGFERMREEIRGSDLDGRVMLATISFDPEHDGAGELADYAERHGGADARWHVLRAPSRHDTDSLLRAAKVIVIPDRLGGFIHNAAILVIAPDGRLMRILDSDATDQALSVARDLLPSG